MKKFGLKTFAVLTAGIATMFIAGCGLLEPTENTDNVSITIETLATFTIPQTGSTTTTATITVEGENERPTIDDVSITTAAGADVATSVVGVTYSQPPAGDDLSFDVTATITINAAACNGDYRLVVDATSGSDQSTKFEEFTLTGNDCSLPTADLTESASLTMGAQTATAGSYLDVDGMAVYNTSGTSGSNVSNQALIDIVLGIGNGKGHFYSPDAVPDGFTAAGWSASNKNTTEFIALTSTDYSSITAESEIQAKFASMTTGSNIEVQNGSVVGVKTSEGNYAMIKVNNVTNQDETNMEITIVGKTNS